MILRIVTIWAIMFHRLFVYNNKYFLLKLWKMVKNMKTNVNRIFFFGKYINILNFCFTDFIYFFYFIEKETYIVIRFHALNNFPKFQRNSTLFNKGANRVILTSVKFGVSHVSRNHVAPVGSRVAHDTFSNIFN